MLGGTSPSCFEQIAKEDYLADRIVALLGPGRGPEVPLLGRRATWRVSGLNGCSEGVHCVVDQHKGVMMYEDGEAELPAGKYARCIYEGESSVICEIVRP